MCLKTTKDQRRITINRYNAVSSHQVFSMAHLLSQKGSFGAFSRTIVLSLVCPVAASNEGRYSSIAIAPQKECKWVGTKACAIPWCHRMAFSR